VHFFDRHFFLHRGHGPRVSERILNRAFAAPVELIGNWNNDSGAGVDSVLEVVVREADGSTPTPERQAELVLAAAKQTAPLGATLYKAEVPFRNLASEEDVVGASRQITEAVTSPWVVLSSGVPADQFPEAVARTARGGAEGFLAGRAIWSNATALTGAAMTDYLTSQSVDTLAGLRESLRLGAAHSTCS